MAGLNKIKCWQNLMRKASRHSFPFFGTKKEEEEHSKLYIYIYNGRNLGSHKFILWPLLLLLSTFHQITLVLLVRFWSFYIAYAICLCKQKGKKGKKASFSSFIHGSRNLEAAKTSGDFKNVKLQLMKIALVNRMKFLSARWRYITLSELS